MGRAKAELLLAASASPTSGRLRRGVLLCRAAGDYYRRGDTASLSEAATAGALSVAMLRRELLDPVLGRGYDDTPEAVRRELVAAETMLGTILVERGNLCGSVAAHAQACVLAEADLAEHDSTDDAARAARRRCAQICHDAAVAMEAFAATRSVAEARATVAAARATKPPPKPLASEEKLAELREYWSPLGARADVERGSPRRTSAALANADDAVGPALRCAAGAARAASVASGVAALWTVAPRGLWKPLRSLSKGERRCARKVERARQERLDDEQLHSDVERTLRDATTAASRDALQLKRVHDALDGKSRVAWDAAQRALERAEASAATAKTVATAAACGEGASARASARGSASMLKSERKRARKRAATALHDAEKAMRHAQKGVSMRPGGDHLDVGGIVKASWHSRKALRIAEGERARAAAINSAAFAAEASQRATASALTAAREALVASMRVAPAAWQCSQLLFQRARALYAEEVAFDGALIQAERSAQKAELAARKEVSVYLIYRYILCESCSQFDLLPLIYIFGFANR